MRTMRKNKQKMFYSNYTDGSPIYDYNSDGTIKYEEYTDSDGTVYRYPIELGQTSPGYSEPKEMFANITLSGGEAEAREFGLDISQYSAVLVCDKNTYDISETSLIWFENAIAYKSIGSTEIEPNSADYRVVKVSPSLNYVKYILQKVINNG